MAVEPIALTAFVPIFITRPQSAPEVQLFVYLATIFTHKAKMVALHLQRTTVALDIAQSTPKSTCQ